MFHLNSVKTTFIIAEGMFFYLVMSFSLKNVRATYQRMMRHLFDGLLGKIMEVYIDDMLVKSWS